MARDYRGFRGRLDPSWARAEVGVREASAQLAESMTLTSTRQAAQERAGVHRLEAEAARAWLCAAERRLAADEAQEIVDELWSYRASTAVSDQSIILKQRQARDSANALYWETMGLAFQAQSLEAAARHARQMLQPVSGPSSDPSYLPASAIAGARANVALTPVAGNARVQTVRPRGSRLIESVVFKSVAALPESERDRYAGEWKGDMESEQLKAFWPRLLWAIEIRFWTVPALRRRVRQLER
jgi:hypothetical protein